MQNIPLEAVGGTLDSAIEYVADKRYVWPGGYALGLIMSDGGILCGSCVKQELPTIKKSTKEKANDGWQATAVIHCDEDDDLEPTCCSHCNLPINR